MFYIELDQRSDAWFSWREKGITATEAVAISGHSPYMTPWRVWAEKTGRVAPADLSKNPNVQYGISHEDEVRSLFENSYLRERCSQTREHPRFLFT